MASTSFIFTLKSGDLSVLYPLTAINYIWTTFFVIFFLEETIGTLRLVGIRVLKAGIVIVTCSWGR